MAGLSVTHYARDDDQQPLCGGGEEGDQMTFFIDQTTCDECVAALNG